MHKLSPALPQELLDKMINDLQSDIATLKICTLTSRTLLTPSQINLFSIIHLPDLQRCRSLRHVLEVNPTLSSRVRKVEVIDPDKWIQLDVNLPYILQATISLQVMCIESSDQQLLWQTIPKDTVDVLIPAFCRPTMLNLSLSMIRDIVIPIYLLGLDMNLVIYFSGM